MMGIRKGEGTTKSELDHFAVIDFGALVSQSLKCLSKASL
jgi:hypothetical protein